MSRRAVDRFAIVALPILAGIASVAPPFTGWVDQCLSLRPNPNCQAHEAAVPPALVLIPLTILWLLAVVDLVRTRRR